VYQISEIDSSEKPPLYSLIDLMNDKVPGHFYGEELLAAPKIDFENHFFEVETIITKKKINNVPHILVKYMYYPNKFNQWIPESNVKPT